MFVFPFGSGSFIGVFTTVLETPMNLMSDTMIISNGYVMVILVRHHVAERKMTPLGEEANTLYTYKPFSLDDH